MISRESAQVSRAQADHRLEEAPGRDDDISPYKRRGDGAASTTKSHYMGDDGMGSAYRWTIALGGDPDMKRPYAQHPWVYAAVSAIGRSASAVPARLQSQSAGTYETDTRSKLFQLLEMPNPLMSQRKFFRQICTSQQLYGETFLILLKRGADGQMRPMEAVSGSGMMATIDMPDEIWPVRGDLVEAVMDEKTKLPSHWRFQARGGYMEYPVHSVVQIAEVNPYNPLRGMGPMQAAYRTAAKDFIIDRYDEALLQNGGSPGGVLSVDGPLTDADQRAISQAWQEAHGRPDQHRKTAVLPQGTKYQEIGMSPQAMEHEKLRDWDRQTILSMFGVPPVVLGLETLNYATAREQNRIFWESTVMPYLDFLTDELQYKFIRRLRGTESSLILDFDISEVSAMREDMDAKVNRAIKLYQEGHRSFAEAARLSGWDITEQEIEGADDRYVLANLVRVSGDEPGLVGNVTGEQPEEEPEEPDEEEIEADEDEEDMPEEERAVDPDKLNEVYATWRKTVNMSASELERWSKNPCSRKASLNPTAVINRNLRLLRKKKSEWNARDIRDANRTISFVSRMKGMPKGKPVTEGCPSKRDISLKNWAYNPDKASRAFVPETREWPDWLGSEAQREEYSRKAVTNMDATMGVVQRRTKRVQREMVLFARKRVRDIAAGAKSVPSKIKAVITEAEIARLLGIELKYWGQELAGAIGAPLQRQMVDAALVLAGEIAANPTILTVDDPFVVDFYKDLPVYLAEGPQSTLAKSIHKAIMDAVMSVEGVGTVATLSQAIREALPQVESALEAEILKLEARADRIAATETTKAYNGARVEEMRRNGIEYHQWLSARDSVVRDSHAIGTGVDGEVRQVGDLFSNGVSYPGEGGAAPASEVVNCRCTTIAASLPS